MSLSDFNSAQEKLESCLQIYIDEFKEHREGGSLEMIYSHTKMSELIPFERLQEIKPIHFLVGNTRSGQLFASLKKIPHLLVAGVTGQGKSTFLRQVITTFYVRNSKWHFTLIDLKEGVVFQTFEDLPRVEVINNMPSAVGSLEVLLKALEERMQILKASGCENIDEYLSLPKEKKKRPEKCQQSLYFDRHIVVIDEIAVMFLAGLHSDAKKIQRSRSIVNKLAAQGRAAGIHVIAATQRPDARSLDTQIKANLPGVLCFHMANNASSMTVLDNGRATDIAPVEGRAVWKHGSKLIEVQTPFLPKEEAEAILAPYRLENAENDNTHKATEPEVVEGSAPALQTDQTPVDSDLDLNE